MFELRQRLRRRKPICLVAVLLYQRLGLREDLGLPDRIVDFIVPSVAGGYVHCAKLHRGAQGDVARAADGQEIAARLLHRALCGGDAYV